MLRKLNKNIITFIFRVSLLISKVKMSSHQMELLRIGLSASALVPVSAVANTSSPITTAIAPATDCFTKKLLISISSESTVSSSNEHTLSLTTTPLFLNITLFNLKRPESLPKRELEAQLLPPKKFYVHLLSYNIE